jgi:hypothetical protein
MQKPKEKLILEKILESKEGVVFDPMNLGNIVTLMIETRRIANLENNKTQLLKAVSDFELRENATIEDMIYNVNFLPRQSVKALQCLEIARRIGIISKKEFVEIDHTLFKATPGIFTKDQKFSSTFRVATNRFLEAYEQMKSENV